MVTAKWWEAVGEINKMSKADGVGSIRRAKGRRRFLRVLSKARQEWMEIVRNDFMRRVGECERWCVQ